MSKWQRRWSQRFPDSPLELIGVAQAEQEAALRDGRVDMCFVRLPIERDGLHAIVLYRERPVVVVGRDHPISLFDEVTTADLTDERMQDAADVDALAATMELLAAAGGAAIVPHSLARLHHRRDLVFRTVIDAPDTEIALVWPIERTDDTVEEFVGIVRGRTERSSRSPSGRAKAVAAEQQRTSGKKGGKAAAAKSSRRGGVARRKPNPGRGGPARRKRR